MTFVETVTRLMSLEVEEIISSATSLEFLKCYSTLYLSGQQPRTCANSHRLYYGQMKTDGLKKAKEMDEIKARTCNPNWGKGCTNSNGLKFIGAEGCHYSSLFITDEQAISLLNRGLLSESDFDILPEGYGVELVEEITPIETNKVQLKGKRGRKAKS